MKIRVLPDGCCGMAGAFGFEDEHYDISAKVGERALLPAVRKAGLHEFVIADGFSCREQISQMSDRHALHIAEVLQLAIHHGSAGPSERLPERQAVDEQRRAIQKSKMEAIAVLGGACAVAAGLFGARKLLSAGRSSKNGSGFNGRRHR